MKRLSYIALTWLALSGAACSSGRSQPHPSKGADGEMQPIGTLDRLPEVPTKPEGGVDVKRKVPLSPEESMARVRRNAAYPVVFGSSAGGISFDTTLTQSFDILSDPFASNENTLYYREGIAVPWATSAPEKPEAIIVMEGYTGVLDVPTEFGDLVVGNSAASIFGDGTGQSFLEAMGRHVLKKDASYNCVSERQCKAKLTCAAGTKDVTSIRLTFPGGLINVANDGRATLEMAAVLPLPKAMQPSLKDPIDLTKGTASVSLAMTRADIEKKVGAPIATPSPTQAFYDNENLVVDYDETTGKPTFIQFQQDYQGPLKLTAKLTMAMGASMAQFFTPSDPNGEALIKDIARLVEGKPDTYDCLKEKTCQIGVSEPLGLFVVKGAIIGIELGCDRKLSIARVRAP